MADTMGNIRRHLVRQATLQELCFSAFYRGRIGYIEQEVEIEE